ncbi:hypothetical protein NDU88_008055 [Pleurodeles waltl]|uniref:Uncharacterized protein n=1 Tax=Pleurodeles waltl TaxID=8319 RepID=A0AAV7QQL4_PLEWA|nr:hypothetical protein NDU88_008055 [Pleurodeles waltl]
MATGQLRLEVPTNPTQQLAVDLPVQEASKRLTAEVHNDRTAHERPNVSRVTSSPTVRKNHLQTGSIVTTAQECDRLLRIATDPPEVLALTDPAVPDPEREGLSNNALRHPGAEWQSQRLRALPSLNPEAATERRRRVEGSLTESPETPRRGQRTRAHRRGVEETSVPTEELENATGIHRAAPVARKAPSVNSGHA